MKKNNNSQKTTKNIAMCGVFAALAMIFGYIESLIPIPIPIYGIKLGIANIVIITILYIGGIKQSIAINIVRISLTALLFGNLNSFIFSMSGGMLSLIVMIAAKKTDKFSIIGVSVIGGIFHNAGQITAAVFIMETAAIYYYLPVLIVSGTIAGIIIGIIGGEVTKRIMPLAKGIE